MARVGFRGVVLDTAGNAQSAVSVNVYNTGTTTNITETMFAAATGAGTLTNPLTTNTRGEVEFWLTNPKRVDLKINTATPLTKVVDLEPARDALNIFTGSVAGDDVIATEVTGDTQKRFILDADGLMRWGSGSAVGDVTLSRLGLGRLQVGGSLDVTSFTVNLDEKTSNYVLTQDDHHILVNAAGAAGNITMTLPTAVGLEGKIFFITRTDADFDFDVIVDPNGSETINGLTTWALTTQYQTLQIVSDDANWVAVNQLPASVKTLTNTTAYTMLDTDSVLLVNAQAVASDVTITLPSAVARLGKHFTIKRTDNDYDFDVVIDPNGSQTIDGATTYTLTTQYESITIVSDGSNWMIV